MDKEVPHAFKDHPGKYRLFSGLFVCSMLYVSVRLSLAPREVVRLRLAHCAGTQAPDHTGAFYLAEGHDGKRTNHISGHPAPAIH